MIVPFITGVFPKVMVGFTRLCSYVVLVLFSIWIVRYVSTPAKVVIQSVVQIMGTIRDQTKAQVINHHQEMKTPLNQTITSLETHRIPMRTHRAINHLQINQVLVRALNQAINQTQETTLNHLQINPTQE